MSDERTEEQSLPGEELLDASTGAISFGFSPPSYDAAAHTVDLRMSAGARVPRWYGFLELAVTPEAVDLSRVAAGKVHLWDSHNTDSIKHIAGNVIGVRFDAGGPIAKVRFNTTELGQYAEGMVARGDLTGASPGITIHSREKIGDQNDAPVYRATRWTPNELSLTGIPADWAAGALSARSSPSETLAAQAPQTEEATMENPNPGAPAATPAAVMPDPEALRIAGTNAVEAERLRVRTIRERTRAAGLPVDVADSLVDSGVEIAHVGNRLIDELAARGAPQHISPARVGADHTDPAVIRERMSDALALRAMRDVPTELRNRAVEQPAQDAAREFMDYGILEMFAGIARAHGDKIPQRMQKAPLYDRLSENLNLSTSDFPLLLASALNKVLLPAYQLANPTFKQFFGRKTFTDFKAHHFLRAGDFPDLLVEGEEGEVKYGKISESDQQITAATYGRAVRISRRIIVNDDLSAFSDIPGMAARRVATFENTLAYKQFALNSNNGPTITEGGVATNLWDAATHVNYTASGTAIAIASLNVGVAAIQNQTTLDGEFPNIVPKFLLAPPAQRALAFQYCSSAYQPTQPSNVNPFSGIIEPIIDANLTGQSATAWYLFADPALAETFVYGYLAGQEGPRFAVKQGFRTEGVDFKVMLDIGVGAVDFRGTYKNAGA